MLNSWERFRDARIADNKHGRQTMDEVAAATGVSKNMISRLEKDPRNNNDKPESESGVKWQAVAKLARHYGVSADYLMGLSEVKTPDQTIQSVCRYTGLSEKAIDVLCHCGEIKLQDGYHDISHGIGKQLLNLLIESDDFYVIMVLLRQCIAAYTVKCNQKSLFTGGDYMDAERIVTEAGQVILKSSEAADFYANKAADYLKLFAREELRAFAEQFCE